MSGGGYGDTAGLELSLAKTLKWKNTRIKDSTGSSLPGVERRILVKGQGESCSRKEVVANSREMYHSGCEGSE